MKDVKKSPFLREMCKTVSNMYRLGWDERNGGNVSLLLDENEVAKYLDPKKVKRTIPIGFDAKDKERVKLVRPSDIMQIDSVIRECFNRGLYHWGDNPCLRWAVNNTKRIRSGKKAGTDTGNFYYGKIEAKSRKTDRQPRRHTSCRTQTRNRISTQK